MFETLLTAAVIGYFLWQDNKNRQAEMKSLSKRVEVLYDIIHRLENRLENEKTLWKYTHSQEEEE